MKDIIAKSGGQEFARLRIGVGGEGGANTKDYVLSRPPASERGMIEEAIATSTEALGCWVDEGIGPAMNKYNVRNSDE